jgi:hypothetical protein
MGEDWNGRLSILTRLSINGTLGGWAWFFASTEIPSEGDER